MLSEGWKKNVGCPESQDYSDRSNYRLSHYFHNWWKLQRRPIPNSYTYVNAKKKENVAKCSKSKECESEQEMHVR